VRIVNGTDIVIAPTRQRTLPIAIERVQAIAEHAVPRTPQWSNLPAASSFRGRVIDLLV